MKLSRFLSQPVTLLAVNIVALKVVVRVPLVASQIVGGVILLAIQALAPTRLSAGIQSPLPAMEQTVVGVVRADYQIRGPVIGSDAVEVVDFLSALQIATEDTLGHQVMLKDVALPVRLRVSVRTFLNISTGGTHNPALPVPVKGTTPSRPTSQHFCAPNVCAVITHQSNIFGGYPLG